MKKSIFEMYEKILRLTPKRVIAIKGDREYTIGEIDSYSDVIKREVEKEFCGYEYVPVYSKCDLFYLVCMIGIWKANKVYTPIQPGFPEKRFEYILDSIGVHKVVSRIDDEETFVEQVRIDFKSYNTCNVSPLLNNYPKGKDVAYLLMTSGSTGKPKGVCVKHENLNWILETMQQLVSFDTDDRFIVSTPVSFDVSFHEILSWLYGKGKIVFIEGVNGVEKFKKLNTILFEGNITHIALSPSAFASLVKLLNKPLANTKLKHIILAGEELLPNVISGYIQESGIHFYNFYGPTETTIYAIGCEVKKAIDNKIPIGKPLPGVNVVLIDDNFEKVSEYGEIAISGDGLTMGYLNDLELNLQKIKDISGVKYYLTGDYAYFKDGEFVFDCRKDNQVELNGMRIELGEIDAAIYDIEKVNCSKTIYKNKKIITFVEKNMLNSLETLQLKLGEYLPTYMLPHKYIEIDEIPLNANRKTDVKKLETIYYDVNYTIQNQENEKADAEKSLEEVKILEVLSEVLDKAVFWDTDLISDYSIDSLEQIEVIVSLEKLFGVEISYNIIQTYRTPKAMCEELLKEKFWGREELLKVDITESIFDNILVHSLHLKDEEYFLFDTYYIQKCYYVGNFSQILFENIRIPEKASKTDLEYQLEKYIANNNLLSAYIVKDKSVKFAIPNRYIADLREYIADIDEDIIGKIIDYLKTKNEGIMFYCFINNGKGGRYLNIFVDHNICDQSSLNILVEELNDLFWRQKIKEKTKNYFDFIRYQNLNVLENSHEKLDKIYRMGFHDVDGIGLMSGDSIGYIRYECINEDKVDMIMDMNYRVMQIIMESQNLNIISAGTLFDMRKFKDLDITDVIGDVHTTLPLLSFRGESFKEFLGRNRQIYDMAYDGFNWNNALYKDYPLIKKEFKKYEYFIDDNQKISTNFIGRIKGNSLEKIVKSIKHENIVLKQFSLSKLYVTAFMYGGDIILVFLNDPLILDDIAEKYDCKVVYY